MLPKQVTNEGAAMVESRERSSRVLFMGCVGTRLAAPGD